MRPWKLTVTPTLQSVSSRLKTLGVIAEIRFVVGPPTQLTIPPENAETGEITVYDEPGSRRMSHGHYFECSKRRLANTMDAHKTGIQC